MSDWHIFRCEKRRVRCSANKTSMLLLINATECYLAHISALVVRRFYGSTHGQAMDDITVMNSKPRRQRGESRKRCTGCRKAGHNCPLPVLRAKMSEAKIPFEKDGTTPQRCRTCYVHKCPGGLAAERVGQDAKNDVRAMVNDQRLDQKSSHEDVRQLERRLVCKHTANAVEAFTTELKQVVEYSVVQHASNATNMLFSDLQVDLPQILLNRGEMLFQTFSSELMQGPTMSDGNPSPFQNVCCTVSADVQQRALQFVALRKDEANKNFLTQLRATTAMLRAKWGDQAMVAFNSDFKNELMRLKLTYVSAEQCQEDASLAIMAALQQTTSSLLAPYVGNESPAVHPSDTHSSLPVAIACIPATSSSPAVSAAFAVPTVPVFARSRVERLSHQMITLAFIPNKGRGVVALQRLEYDDRLLKDDSICVRRHFNEAKSRIGEFRMAGQLVTKWKREMMDMWPQTDFVREPVPLEYQSTCLEADIWSRAIAVIKFNAFKLSDADEVWDQLNPLLCFFNHSCVPNAEINGDEARALRRVDTTEELTISYLQFEPGCTKRQRDRELFARWKFHCDCYLCARNEPIPRKDTMNVKASAKRTPSKNRKRRRSKFKNASARKIAETNIYSPRQFKHHRGPPSSATSSTSSTSATKANNSTTDGDCSMNINTHGNVDAFGTDVGTNVAPTWQRRVCTFITN